MGNKKSTLSAFAALMVGSKTRKKTSRRAPQDHINAIIKIWWDIENCLIPTGVPPSRVAGRITTSLRRLGYNGLVDITAVAANNEKITPTMQEQLRASGVRFVSVGSTEKQVSDDEIIRQIRLWRRSTPLPANVMLISGDSDFLEVFTELSSLGFNLLNASRPDADSDDLIDLAHTWWDWRMLLGLGHRKQKKYSFRMSSSPPQRDPSSSPEPETKRPRNRFSILNRSRSSHV